MPIVTRNDDDGDGSPMRKIDDQCQNGLRNGTKRKSFGNFSQLLDHGTFKEIAAFTARCDRVRKSSENN